MKKNRYFVRDGFPVKLIYNNENKRYDAYVVNFITGDFQFKPSYYAKVMGWFYPPGSDLYFDEIKEDKYNNYVAIMQRRAERKMPFYCIVDGEALKVILEERTLRIKGKEEQSLIRVIYVYDEFKKAFRFGGQYLEKVYGEKESKVKYVSEEEFNDYIKEA